MNIALPGFAKPLFKPSRYKVLYGGRGSAKSYSVASALLVRGAKEQRRILCAREFQNSISESVHKLLEERITELGLSKHYSVTRDRIAGKKTGTEFIFKGVRMNADSIKSMQGLTDLWLEEAQMVSERSWDILVPTIRMPGSEIYVTFNPENESDPTYTRFVGKDGKPLNRKDAYIARVNWDDNPWFPEVLRTEKDHAYATNPELAEHIWGGACRSHSDAQIFKGKYRVDLFQVESHFDGPYFGADWGFSSDPTCLVKLYIDAQGRRLFIDNETGDLSGKSHDRGVGVELDDIPELFDQIPQSRDFVIRADCARPETISHVSRKGFNVQPAKKWSGSVEDGIEFIKSFREVVIHPRCEGTRQEFKNYSYKVDRLTGDITTDVVDAWNHRIDAIRYALEPMISSDVSILDIF